MMTMSSTEDVTEQPTAIEIVTRTTVEILTFTDSITGEVAHFVDARDADGVLIDSKPFTSLADAQAYAELGIL